MKLVEANKEYEDAFRDMASDFVGAADGREERYQGVLDDFQGYVEKIEKYKNSQNLLKNFVPGTEFWLINDQGRILGTSRLRFYLLRHLEQEGGHIGYDIRPSERNKGYGTELLKLTLAEARSYGIDTILVTCDEDNMASIRVIHKNGGRLTGEAVSDNSKKRVLHFSF